MVNASGRDLDAAAAAVVAACRSAVIGAIQAVQVTFPVRRTGGLVLALLLAVAQARAEWPLVWDFDGRSDTPVAARLAPDGDLLVLLESYSQGSGVPSAVLARIDPTGEVSWATADHELSAPAGLALAEDGRVLALGRTGGTVLRVTSFSPAGAIEWSRTRSGLSPDFAEYGPAAQPVWDAPVSAWRVPSGLGGDLVVLSWTAAGDPLPDRLWSPPSGEAVATAVVPRPGGGLLVTGRVDLVVPAWWTVALDAAGAEDWSWFEDGGTDAGTFSGAFPLSADPQRVTVWADDETGCGLFSLRLWSLDAATGAPLWDATWPPPGGCTSFIPDVVSLSGDRIIASGATTHLGSPSSPDAAAIAFDAATGITLWERSHHRDTNAIRADLASFDGTALVASTLFPPVNPGPTPLWLSPWDRNGDACAEPFELLPASVAASFADAAGRWLIVGSASAGVTGIDLVVQRVEDPCRALFADGFESASTQAWSATVP